METIGLIGAGLLGSALAARLSGAGFGVLAFDLDPARCIGTKSAQQVVSGCRRVVLCLPTSDISDAVVDTLDFGAGAMVIDTTTGDPEAMAAIGARLAGRGVEYMDAAIGGSSRVVREGQAIVMAGGSAEAFAACRDLFAAIAARAFHLGPCGSGARMKLVGNLALGLNRAVLAEALAFARACGVDGDAALEVLTAGPSYSRVMDTKGPKMLSGDFTPEARLAQHLKDVRLILAEAARYGASTPLSGLHQELLKRAEAAGLGDLDNSAICKMWD
jgi:3-hydroxyisobutyrate dehydrogenase-like beta-hydroxyacid dehydrogenase